MLRILLKVVAVIWTLPNTLLGCLLGVLALASGGKVGFRRGAIEFHGGLVRILLGRLPNNIHAITLGHAILGLQQASLDLARDHEHVHVRQYEWWGPLFIPAYLGSSLFMKLTGKDPYYDNPFEVQAYAVSSPDFSRIANGDPDYKPPSEDA